MTQIQVFRVAVVNRNKRIILYIIKLMMFYKKVFLLDLKWTVHEI